MSSAQWHADQALGEKAQREWEAETRLLRANSDRLAKYIMENVPGEPSESEGAVDCAIRIMRNLATGLATVGRERDGLRRDLQEIAAGLGVGCADGEEAKRRIIAIGVERDAVVRERDAARASGRRFPIQGGPSIPWRIIAPHEAQAETNHDQSLERLAQRGGLSPAEAHFVLADRKWPRGMSDEDWCQAEIAALAELNAINATDNQLIADLAAALRAYDTAHIEHDTEVKRLIAEINRLLVDLAAARQQLEEVKAKYDAFKATRCDSCPVHPTVVTVQERAAAVQQVARLTEALRGIYATKVRRSGGSFGFNIKFNGTYSRELSDLIYLTPPAARQGEKEKP